MRQLNPFREIGFILGAGFLLLISTGCATRSVDEPSEESSRQDTLYVSQALEVDVDLLFVIDNSTSMEAEQENLRRNFPTLIEALRNERLGAVSSDPQDVARCKQGDTSRCRIPNVHIGVISTDLGAGPYNVPTCERFDGDGGKLQNAARRPGCIPPEQKWISYHFDKNNDAAITNVPSGSDDAIQRVGDSFSCIANLGDQGCGFEQPLESAMRALDQAVTPSNAGFLRDDALLVVVFITDEDDCSTRDPLLFDPSSEKIDDPLGPLTSFRCFEYGIRCGEPRNAMRSDFGRRDNCAPNDDSPYLHSAQRYIDFFQSVKPTGKVLLAAITGPTDRVEVIQKGTNSALKPSCRSDLGDAAPAIRLEAVLNAMPAGDSMLTSICDGDFGPALGQLGAKIIGKLGSGCIRSPLLTERGGLACQAGERLAPGVICEESCLEHTFCDVKEIRPGQDPIDVPICPTNRFYPDDYQRDNRCPAGSTQDPCCWRIVNKPGECNPDREGTPYGIDILRRTEAPKGTVAEVHCLTSPIPWNDARLANRSQCR